MTADIPIGWLMTLVAVFALAMTTSLLALLVLVPPLYRAGLTQMRIWLTPDHPQPTELSERRRMEAVTAYRRQP